MDFKIDVFSMLEIGLDSDKNYQHPFIDVELYCRFESPKGKSMRAMKRIG